LVGKEFIENYTYPGKFPKDTFKFDSKILSSCFLLINNQQKQQTESILIVALENKDIFYLKANNLKHR
jgi:hypothetical protein